MAYFGCLAALWIERPSQVQAMARVIVIIISIPEATVLLKYQEIKTSGRNWKLRQHKLQLQLLPPVRWDGIYVYNQARTRIFWFRFFIFFANQSWSLTVYLITNKWKCVGSENKIDTAALHSGVYTCKQVTMNIQFS